ncbi:MAG: prepilin-type N-terminal cleavage/methylation domain-containing protein [Syntrophaceae bacterium]
MFSKTSSSPLSRPSEHGFTLIEVVLAVFIAVIVVASVNASFYRSQQVMRTVQQQSEVYQMGRMALDRMVKDLTCAYVPQLAETATTGGVEPGEVDVLDQYRFIGKHELNGTTDLDSIDLTTTSDLGFGDYRGLVTEVDYYLKEVEAGKGVYYLMRREDALPHTGETTVGTEMEMAEDVTSMNIIFIDQVGIESEEWNLNTRGSLPSQVRITLTFKRGETTYPFTGVAQLPLAWINVQRTGG